MPNELGKITIPYTNGYVVVENVSHDDVDCIIEQIECDPQEEIPTFKEESKSNEPAESYDISKSELNPRQEMFCQLFATESEFFGNGVQSYIEAYDIDLTRKGAYAIARASASENLTKPNILKRINELLDASGFNDSNADKQLFIVMQQNADFSSKVAAIREYNKLKKRIVEKMELAGKDGGPIETKQTHTIPNTALEALGNAIARATTEN